MAKYNFIDLLIKCTTPDNDDGIWNLDDDELHFVCCKINEFYDKMDFDNYDRWLECLTLSTKQYNWLEDLCTDLRNLGKWSKC